MASRKPSPDVNTRTTCRRPAPKCAAKLYLTLAQVPPGKVVSYGQLGEMAGLGRAARWVGRTLSQLPHGTRLPWHRVIAAGGRLSLPAGSPSGDEQRARLRAEGSSSITNGWICVGMAGFPCHPRVRVRALSRFRRVHLVMDRPVISGLHA